MGGHPKMEWVYWRQRNTQMDTLDAQILEREMKVQELRAALAQVENDLQALYRAREILKGKTDPEAAAQKSLRGRSSIPTQVEQILKDHGEMHVDEIVEKLKLRGLDVTKQTVTSALSRWVAKGKRFERVGKNKFALRAST